MQKPPAVTHHLTNGFGGSENMKAPEKYFSANFSREIIYQKYLQRPLQASRAWSKITAVRVGI